MLVRSFLALLQAVFMAGFGLLLRLWGHLWVFPYGAYVAWKLLNDAIIHCITHAGWGRRFGLGGDTGQPLSVTTYHRAWFWFVVVRGLLWRVT